MSCINKSLPAYKRLADVYGHTIAEALVRRYTRNQGKEEFVYPTLMQVRRWLTDEKSRVVPSVIRAFQLDPYISEQGIRSLLRGVIHINPNDGQIYLSKGTVDMPLTDRATATGEFAEPNLRIMKVLAQRYPSVFTLIPLGKGKYDYRIKISPVKKGELPFLQRPETAMSSASASTIKMLKEFATKIGVTISPTDKIVINGTTLDANAAALMLQRLIQVVEGKESSALPEEAMHFAVEILQQKNPKLFNKLMKEINSYNMYKEVLRTYGNDPLYQTKDGKPDILKLKKEAIGKVLAETIINKSEGQTEFSENLAKTQTWWQAILEYFKSLFMTSGFDRAAMQVISGNFEGSVEDIRSDDIFLQLSEQERIYNQIKDTHDKMTPPDNKVEGSKYTIDGKKISRRVHDLVNTWYERKFKDKALLKSDYQQAVYDLKQEKGTKGHAAFHYAFKKLVDENGYLRDVPLSEDDYASENPGFSFEMYEILRNNLRQRMESLDNNRANGRTRFMAEVMLYNPSRDIAGTVDFLAIKPNGKVNVYDWKFIDVDVSRTDDVPWYKIQNWQLQMNQYKLLLQYGYEIKPENFEHTRMIPIRAVYSYGDRQKKILPRLDEIIIGDVDVQKIPINRSWLLPVGLETETTGNKKMDELLGKLNTVYDILSKRKVTEEEKSEKKDELNRLYKAIRQLQIRQNIAPLIQQAQTVKLIADRAIEKYNSKFKDKDPNLFTNEEINEFARELNEVSEIIQFYNNLDVDLNDIFQGELTEKDKELKAALETTVTEARKVERLVENTLEDFVEQIVAKSVGVDEFLAPEKVISGLSRLFVSTSGLQTRAIQILYKKANEAFTRVAFETQSENERIRQIRENYIRWAAARGIKQKDYFNIIKKKDKNELIDEFDRQFYRKVEANVMEKDYEWVKNNIDIPAYREHLKQVIINEKAKILNRVRPLSAREQELWEQGDYPADVQKDLDNVDRLYDLSTRESLGWFVASEVKKFPNVEIWTSKEWKELNKPENAPAKELYDYIIEKNKEYAKIGYINNPRTFLPFVRKTLLEKFAVGGKAAIGERFLRAISVDEAEVGYGVIDKLTGLPVNSIPKYFTTEFEGDVSEDLFKTMGMYNEAAIRYKYLRQIEDQINAIAKVERNKKSITTSRFGRTITENGQIKFSDTNEKNSELLQKMIKAIVYGQKYIDSEAFDQIIGKIGKWGERINEKMGVKLFPEDLSERQLTVNKTVDQINLVFQLNTLGLNLLSATSNFLGGSFQSMINAGMYFTKKDYATAELQIFVNRFGGENREKMLAAIEYFLPLTNNYNRDIIKHLSLHKVNQESLQDLLMVLMRKSDFVVQAANFYAYLANTIVMDGKVMNVRQYLRSLPEYSSKYEGTKAHRELFEERFEEQVKKLVDEFGIMKTAVVENGKFTIPGIDRNSKGVMDVRRLVQQMSKDALGNLSEDDLRSINMNIYGKSFMVFKNWIPRLIDVRMGNMKYNSATDAYEWGRTRMVVRVMAEDIKKSLGNLYGILVGNDRGIELMKELYDKKRTDYKNDTNKDLKMTEAEFMDLVAANVRNQVLDLIFLMTMLGLVIALRDFEPDDDEADEVVRNQYKFLIRMMDKFAGELSYFYDPTSIMGWVSMGVFPAMSLVKNFQKGFVNFFRENWALLMGDEEKVEDIKVIKYWMKMFPFTNQMSGYLPMFYPELAKDLGIRVQSNYGALR